MAFQLNFQMLAVLSLICAVASVVLALVNEFSPIAIRSIHQEKEHMGFEFGGLYTWTKDANPEVKVATFREMNAYGQCERAYWYGRICNILNIITVAILAVSAVLIMSSAWFNPLPVSNLKFAGMFLVLSELLGIVAWPMALSMYKKPLCSEPMTGTPYAVYTPEIALPDQPIPKWSLSAVIPVMILEWIIVLGVTGFVVGASRNDPGLVDWCSNSLAKWKEKRKKSTDDSDSVPMTLQSPNSDFI